MSADGSVLRAGLQRVLDRLCCPRCLARHGEPPEGFVHYGDSLRCGSCAEEYAIRSGVPDLRPDQGRHLTDSVSERAVRFYERVYSDGSYGRGIQQEQVEKKGRHLAHIPSDGFVLELGTGLGALQGMHPAYVGTDLSVEALVRHIRGAAFASDAQCLPIRAESVDAIYTVAVLEHVPRPELALSEIARILRPGGVAYLAPAWNCRPWAAEGLHVRPYRDLHLGQRIRKLAIPLRDSLLWRGFFAIPRRAARRAIWLARRRPAKYRYRTLRANFEVYWASDSDATAQLDPHETALYFESRGWCVEHPPTALGRLFHRAGPLVVRRS